MRVLFDASSDLKCQPRLKLKIDVFKTDILLKIFWTSDSYEYYVLTFQLCQSSCTALKPTYSVLQESAMIYNNNAISEHIQLEYVFL